MRNILSTLFLFLHIGVVSLYGQTTKKLPDINIRDPYIVADTTSGYYYMYKSAGGVEVYKSKDLKEWKGPVQVFTVPSDNWITGGIWAPDLSAPVGNPVTLFHASTADCVLLFLDLTGRKARK